MANLEKKSNLEKVAVILLAGIFIAFMVVGMNSIVKSNEKPIDATVKISVESPSGIEGFEGNIQGIRSSNAPIINPFQNVIGRGLFLPLIHQGATSTASSITGCAGCQTPTTTGYVWLEGADSVSFQWTFRPSTTDSTIGYYYEITNDSDCTITALYNVIPTTTPDLLVAGTRNINFSFLDADGLPLNTVEPGAIATTTWSDIITGINGSCIRVTASFASTTDDSLVWLRVFKQ